MDEMGLREDVEALRERAARLEEENNRLFALLDTETSSPEASGLHDAVGARAAASWAERATAQDWVELIDWADWLLATYQVQQCYLFACWPAHPGIVDDLAALKMAWDEAAVKTADAGWKATEAMAYWHDRYMPGFFARLHPVHSAAMCKHKHETGPRPARTDRDYAVIDATGQPLTDALVEHRDDTSTPVTGEQ